MYDDFLLNNGFNYDLNLNLPYSANKPPLKLDDMDDERIEDEDSFFNEKLPNKLFKDGDEVETHFEKIIQSDTFFTTLNKKRNLSNDFLFKDEEEKEEKGEEIKEEEIGLLEDKEKGSDQIQGNEKVKKKKGNQGRKSFEDESEGKHTKDSEDNMLRKIKSYFVGSFHNYLNSIIQNPELKLTKIDFYVCKELKKEFNEKLFQTNLKVIYETVNLSDKFANLIKNEPDKNKKIIERIFNENKEVEVIKILSLTFDEVYQIFISRYCPLSPELRKKIEGTNILTSKEFWKLDEFLIYIKEKFEKEKKKKKNQININDYISKIKNLCLGLKNWFEIKNGRKNRIETKYKF
jgi:hypothetical protein